MRELKHRRAIPTYYVRLDTCWQNSADWFAGPYDNRLLAQNAIDRALCAANSQVVLLGQHAENVRVAIRVWGILSKSQAERVGMRDYATTRSNVIGERIPLDTDDLFEMQRQD